MQKGCFNLTSADESARSVHAELRAKAVDLQPLVRLWASAGEMDRAVAREVVDAIADAGFFRLLVPRQYRGYEAAIRTIMEVTETIGAADGSTAWLIAIGATTSWICAHLPDRAQDEIFGAQTPAMFAGGGKPAPAVRVDGGVRVSGRWGFASGSHYATWGIVMVLVESSEARPDARLCLVPRDELRLENTWHTVGMRGTGSNTWAADELFVPEHRLIPVSVLTEGAGPARSDSAMYRLAFGPMAGVLLLGPLLGMGRAALDVTIDKLPGKSLEHTMIGSKSNSVGVQVQLAEAACKLQTARLHSYQIAEEIDHIATEHGDPFDYAMRSRIRAQCGYAAHQVLGSINLLLNVFGAGSFAETSVLQQYWRDANTAARHASLDAAVGYEVYGKSLLGIADRISPLV
jgi:alkylation response protein AidB-like acyl-CoA dehydrogenase